MVEYWKDARDFPPTVGTVCLPIGRMPTSEWVTTAGWGGVDAENSQSTNLKEVQY